MIDLDPLVRALIAERVQRGMTVADVARRMGHPHRMKVYIGRWESGEVAPTLPLLRLWATALGLDLTAVVQS